MNLATAFATVAERRLDATAICCGNAELSYGQLLAQARHVAQTLRRDFGVRPGDRVAVWLHNCPEFVPALFGAWLAGGVVVMINHFLKPDEITYLLQDSGAAVVITERAMEEAQTKLRAVQPGLKFFLKENISTLPAPPAEPAPQTESDLAALLYTSGTTGQPKGAMLTHGNFLHNVSSCVRMLDFTDHDRLGVLLPQFHSFMFTVGTLLPMLCGASILLVRSLHPMKGVLEEIIRHRGTLLPAVPQLFRALTQLHAPPPLPVRLCVSGGAPLPVEVLREFLAIYPIQMREGYGPTESSPVATFNPLHGPWKEGSVGRPIPDVELSIRDESGVALFDGATGEICIRGGNVMRGYWNQPEETAKTIRDGWLYTGDIGHRDADGFYFITDRKKDMLLVNGINVYPRQVEEVIYQFPGVKEAAVVGIPDARKGEHPVAFLVPKDGMAVDEKALLHFLREKLADYKVPRKVHFLAALPRNATGKILKTELRRLAK
ncbi:MAG: long-chain fatty acid--CoA ligase [Verrucomicrobia bacterium]|nr:long-chain fatty acid--CoA ligase [Verrucomicrobiota bacterium]